MRTVTGCFSRPNKKRNQRESSYFDIPVDKLSIDGCRCEDGAVCFVPFVHRHLPETEQHVQDCSYNTQQWHK